MYNELRRNEYICTSTEMSACRNLRWIELKNTNKHIIMNSKSTVQLYTTSKSKTKCEDNGDRKTGSGKEARKEKTVFAR